MCREFLTRNFGATLRRRFAGTGHNTLVAQAYLSRASLSTLSLDRAQNQAADVLCELCVLL